MEENKIVSIDVLRINYSRDKICKCYDYYKNKPSYEIDMKNRLVYCNKCHVIVDAFDALYNISKDIDRINGEVHQAIRYKKELEEYKPYLKEARRYEKMMREKYMLPVCPNCREAFEWNQITSMTNKKFLKR